MELELLIYFRVSYYHVDLLIFVDVILRRYLMPNTYAICPWIIIYAALDDLKVIFGCDQAGYEVSVSLSGCVTLWDSKDRGFVAPVIITGPHTTVLPGKYILVSTLYNIQNNRVYWSVEYHSLHCETLCWKWRAPRAFFIIGDTWGHGLVFHGSVG